MLTQSIEKSFLIDPLSTDTMIYRDSFNINRHATRKKYTSRVTLLMTKELSKAFM